MRIPVDYKPDAECQMIRKFITSTIPLDCLEILFEMFGYCLIPDTRYEKAFMLTGTGANGKSTLLHLLEAFIGTENVSKIPLQELYEHRFKRAELFGKSVNLFADLDNRALKNTSYFKTIVSGDQIDAERKHRNPFSFKPFSRLVFSSNEIPRSWDNSDAYFRRWVIIPFPNVFKGKNANKQLKDQITTDAELSGLLNMALKGLSRLWEQQDFSEPETVKRQLEAYKKQNDPVSAFVDECCYIGPNQEVERGQLYDAFVKFCNENGYAELSKIKFYQRTRTLKGVSETKTPKERLFSGIGITCF